MFRKSPDLHIPFQKGENVVTTQDLPGINAGTHGVVKLANGLGKWRRYWVNFDGTLVGQVSHDHIVKPKNLDDWKKNQAEELAKTAAATKGAEPAGPDETAPEAPPNTLQIPEALLERSRAAKKRLLQ